VLLQTWDEEFELEGDFDGPVKLRPLAQHSQEDDSEEWIPSTPMGEPAHEDWDDDFSSLNMNGSSMENVHHLVPSSAEQPEEEWDNWDDDFKM